MAQSWSYTKERGTVSPERRVSSCENSVIEDITALDILKFPIFAPEDYTPTDYSSEAGGEPTWEAC